MNEEIEKLPPEWRSALSNIATFRRISEDEAFELAKKVEEIWRFTNIIDGISYLNEVVETEKRLAIAANAAGIAAVS